MIDGLLVAAWGGWTGTGFHSENPNPAPAPVA
jgi:hypothetical protein